jgi:hypothetical protein
MDLLRADHLREMCSICKQVLTPTCKYVNDSNDSADRRMSAAASRAGAMQSEFGSRSTYMPLPDYALLAKAERTIAASAQSEFRRDMHLRIAEDYERRIVTAAEELAPVEPGLEAVRRPCASGLLFGARAGGD